MAKARKRARKKPAKKKGNAPTKVFRYSPVSAAIFKKSSGKGNQKTTFYDTKIVRTYVDSGNEYQETDYYRESDLVKVEDAARDARLYVQKARAAENRGEEVEEDEE